MFIRHSILRHGALCVLAAILAACGTQSPPAATSVETNAAAAQQPQNMSLAELTAGSQSPESTPAPSEADSATSDLASTTPSSADSAADPDPATDAEYAKVVSVQPVKAPQRVCTNRVVQRDSPEDRHQVAGTVIGAIAGGVLGHQLGGGRGRDITTVGGAVAGGIAGKKIQEGHQARDAGTRVVKICHNVKRSDKFATLYDVVYAYQGETFHVRLDHDPGNRMVLPVRGIE